MSASMHAGSDDVLEPVLLIGFNRPDHMRLLIDRLREVEPREIYVAIDGPRPDRPGEADQVRECRQLVSEIDWESNVYTLFQDANLGCGLGVSTAISWFFDNVPRGIILEDDIVPDPSFFPFCAELLDRYETDERVLAISGCNFVPPEGITRPDDAYRFSQVPHIWGWATWRRSWSLHRLDIADWRTRLPLRTLFRRVHGSVAGMAYWAGIFSVLGRGEIDTWDGQLVLASMISGQLTATSNRNMIENIGFDELATHTFEDRRELQPVVSMVTPTAPVPVEVDTRADDWTRRNHFHATVSGMVSQGSLYVRRRLGRS
jgi:hypothetical protein